MQTREKKNIMLAIQLHRFRMWHPLNPINSVANIELRCQAFQPRFIGPTTNNSKTGARLPLQKLSKGT